MSKQAEKKIKINDGKKFKQAEDNQPVNEEETCESGKETSARSKDEGVDSQESGKDKEFAATDGVSSSAGETGKSAEVDWQDRCLRIQAELANATKTIPKRIAEGVGRFKRNHFLALLDLVDGFDRAAQHFDESSSEWQEGFASLQRILIEILNKAGVKKLDCLGKKFDPNWHEVVSTVPNPELEDGTILDVVRSGWMMDEKLLRAAMVVVVKND